MDPVWNDPKTYDFAYAMPPVRMATCAWEKLIVKLRSMPDDETKVGEPSYAVIADTIEDQLRRARDAFEMEPRGAVFESRLRKKAA